jgi:D-beta-D-heptose 7-phosphate kinase/D-beta-D-heptose 1-phosphate adenosyltransferase
MIPKEVITKEFKKKNVLVIGDLMVDEYIIGSVKRISPEAPVPVLNFKGMERMAGGAANVVKNIKALGANVCVAGIAAKDDAGEWLRESLKREGIGIGGIIEDNQNPTIIKTRYATRGQQLLRVDREVTSGIASDTKKRMLWFLEEIIPNMDAVILSDYCKGLFADPFFVRQIISICNQSKTFVSIDSKRKDIACFCGADYVKPNNLELEAAVGIEITDTKSLDRAGRAYLEQSGASMLVVTRGAKGISVFLQGCERKDYPANQKIQVFDVTGAGDTVISTSSLALVSGISVDDAMYLANLAAEIVICQVGTVAIKWEELVKYVDQK